MLRLTEHADVSSDATCKEALPQTGREGLLFFYFSFCSVARWDATFWAFRGIGEGGTAFPRESWSRGVGPCGPRYAGAPPRAPGDFRFTTKVTKGVSGGIPLNPRGGCFAPPAASRTPSIGGSGTNLAGFATLRWCGQLAFLSLRAPMEETPTAFKPWRGRGGLMGTGGVGTEEVRFL